jgi:hypothetical protein
MCLLKVFAHQSPPFIDEDGRPLKYPRGQKKIKIRIQMFLGTQNFDRPNFKGSPPPRKEKVLLRVLG